MTLSWMPRLAASAAVVAAIGGGLQAAGRPAGAQTQAPAATARTVSAVADAAMRRDLAGVRTLVRAGGDVNGAQGDGMTALKPPWLATCNGVKRPRRLVAFTLAPA